MNFFKILKNYWIKNKLLLQLALVAYFLFMTCCIFIVYLNFWSDFPKLIFVAGPILFITIFSSLAFVNHLLSNAINSCKKNQGLYF